MPFPIANLGLVWQLLQNYPARTMLSPSSIKILKFVKIMKSIRMVAAANSTL